MRAYSHRSDGFQWLSPSFFLCLMLAGTVHGSASSLVPLAKTLKTVTVSPSTASIPVGVTELFKATAKYSDGSAADVTRTASWKAANKAVASIDSSGQVTAVAKGSTTVTATLSSVSGTAAIAVRVVKSIAVLPASASVFAGATRQFTATATYLNGTTANVTKMATWKAANREVATTNSTGLVSGVASGSTTLTATIGSIRGTATVKVAANTVKAISVSPSPESFAMGTTKQFTATAIYSDGARTNVTKTATWKAENVEVATINSSGLATGVASGSTTVTASFKSTTGDALLKVTIPPGTGANVLTFHFDSNRSGLNPEEASLSPANLSPLTFGKIFSYLVDGYAYGEPLLVSNLPIKGSVRNVLYTATEHDSVYAFDADNYGNGTPLWHVSLLRTGETPMTDGPIQPYQGVTSTPVIDLTTDTMYVVSAQTLADASPTFRLNALDIASGAQKFGGPITIQASVPGTNSDSVDGEDHLNTSCIQRAALLLANGSVYIGFGGCHSGWLLAYNARKLTQTGVFNASPNLNGEGKYASAGGVWMGGGGPLADSAGNIFITTGNGPWDGKTAFSDSVLKFNSTLKMEDYFTPNDYQYMDCNDADLASGGLLLIPGTARALAGGKTGKLYLVNTADLGHENANDAGAIQTLWFESDLIDPYPSSCTDASGTHTTDINSYEIFGTAAYFNGSAYLGITPTSLIAPAGVRQFIYSAASGKLTPGPHTDPNIQENTRGTTPFISANGATNGILWMIDTGQPLQNSGQNAPTSATLRAYDAEQFPKELYNSGVHVEDVPGFGIKFTSPIVANGKVYISTGHDPATVSNPRGEIDVYGLK